MLLVQRPQDRDDLVGRLAGAVHDLGVAGARRAVDVDAGEAEVLGAVVHRRSPEGISGINAQDLHLGGEELQLLERVAESGGPGDGPSTSARNWVAVHSPPTM